MARAIFRTSDLGVKQKQYLKSPTRIRFSHAVIDMSALTRKFAKPLSFKSGWTKKCFEIYAAVENRNEVALIVARNITSVAGVQ